jgi:hypothetical protein
VKTTLVILLFWTLCAGSATIVRAVCISASVNSFGAKADCVLPVSELPKAARITPAVGLSALHRTAGTPVCGASRRRR